MQYPILAVFILSSACRLGFELPGAAADDAGNAPADGANSANDAATGDATATDASAPPADGPDFLGFCGPGIPGLVACYHFDDGTGQDESGFDNDLSVSGASFVPGVSGGLALRTEAGSMAVAAADPSLVVSELTIEMWVYPEAWPGSGRAGLLDHNNQYSIFLYPGEIWGGGLGFVVLDETLPLDTWTHIALTNDASAQRLWINGVERATGPAVALGTGGVEGMGIGQNVPANDNFRGAIDSVRVFGSVRSAGELCAAAAPNCP